MRKIKEVLRLKWELGLPARQIAHSLSISHSTVLSMLDRAEQAGLSWPIPDLDDAELEAKLYPSGPELPKNRPEPDLAYIHSQLQRKGVTLQLLWLEYKQSHPDGLQYTQFTQRYRAWKSKLDVVLRHHHRAGEQMQVEVVERWIMAPIRNRTFFSLSELNEAIRELLAALNNKPFQKLDGSRHTLFESLDKPALRPLPTRRFEYAEWRKAKVNIDYHVEVDHNYYSVPYQLVHQAVDVRLTSTTVEILHEGKRVASHPRATGRGGYITQVQHRPVSHQRHLEWTPSRLVGWAESIGPQTALLVKTVLERKPHPEQGYRSCLGIMRLGRRYGSQRMEAAANRAVASQACTYQSVKSILERNLDSAPLASTEPSAPTPTHQNLRGPSYYAEEGNAPC